MGYADTNDPAARIAAMEERITKLEKALKIK